jgi:hypothetical protein
MNHEIAKLVAKAFSGGVEITLRQLTEPFDISNLSILDACIVLQSSLESLGLEIFPSYSEGDFDTRRALLPAKREVCKDEIIGLIETGEHWQLEFKSTLSCDYRAYCETPLRICKNEGVTHAVLKSVCAFANCDGGKVLVGVEDSGNVCGIEPDFKLIKSDQDGWENHLRSLISSRFYRGKYVNNFVSVKFLTYFGKTVSQIEVVPRTDSTFLKHPKEDRYEYFVRQGNRSTSLEIQYFEEHLRSRSHLY